MAISSWKSVRRGIRIIHGWVLWTLYNYSDFTILFQGLCPRNWFFEWDSGTGSPLSEAEAHDTLLRLCFLVWSGIQEPQHKSLMTEPVKQNLQVCWNGVVVICIFVVVSEFNNFIFVDVLYMLCIIKLWIICTVCCGVFIFEVYENLQK